MPATPAPPPAGPVSAPPVVAYLTDVEGLWSKLLGFLDGNPHVGLDGEGRLRVAPGAVFVFGGDAIDRGAWGRRIVAALLEAKGRQPDQVILLAGNRDINKLRLPRELGGFPPRRLPDELRGQSRPELLRWIFCNTMGARQAFDCRLEELARGRGPAGDDEVVESFLADLVPNGDLTRYLAACQLAYRVGSTLFVHGSVTPENLGRVPGSSRLFDDVDAWAAALNGWYRAQVDAYVRGELGPGGDPLWAPLVAYQAPLPGTKLNQSSVVYARPTDDAGNPSLPPPAIVEALARCGVRRVVVGHSPVGDSPALLRSANFEFLAADNSYSPVEAGARVFVGEELVETDAPVKLGDGVERVRISQVFGDDSPVGKRVDPGGFLVKGQLSSGDFLLHRAHAGFRVEQRAISPRQLRSLALSDAWLDPRLAPRCPPRPQRLDGPGDLSLGQPGGQAGDHPAHPRKPLGVGVDLVIERGMRLSGGAVGPQPRQDLRRAADPPRRPVDQLTPEPGSPQQPLDGGQGQLEPPARRQHHAAARRPPDLLEQGHRGRVEQLGRVRGQRQRAARVAR